MHQTWPLSHGVHSLVDRDGEVNRIVQKRNTGIMMQAYIWHSGFLDGRSK